METVSKFSQLYMSKKSIHIVLSLASVLSFVLVSYSSLFLPLPLPLLSTFSINLFSYSSERNYIFLLCNGILVFLIKNSGSIASSSLVTDRVEYSTQVEQTRDQEEEEEEEEERKTQNEILVSVSDNENEEEKQEHFLDIQEDDNKYCNDDKNEEQDEEEEEEEEKEEEEDEEREELNKRCEEFIRRMKQDIQNETTRQLISSS